MSGIEPTYLEHLHNTKGILSYQLDMTSAEKPDRETIVTITLQTPAGPQRLAVRQYRSQLTHEIVDHLIVRPPSAPTLLLAPSIGAALGAKLAHAGINYLDRSGNCHLEFGSFYVHVEGRAVASLPTADKGLRAAGYQVLFCYLAQPTLLNATVRAVAGAAGVSRQPVSDMRHRLLDDGYIIETGSTGRWVPQRQEDALGLWLHGYETTVRPALLHGIYRTNDRSPKELEARLAATFRDGEVSEFRWGGSAAGFRLAGHYRGERTVVHVHATPGDLRQRLRLLSDPHGNLILMDAFGEINWQSEQETVHPLLVYSEMLREKSERASEAAREIFTTRIQPLWNHGS